MSRHQLTVILFVLSLFFSTSMAHSGSEGTFCPHLHLDHQNKRYLLKYARDLLEQDRKMPKAAEDFPETLAAVTNPLIVSLFSAKGELLVSKKAEARNTGLQTKMNRCIDRIKEELDYSNTSPGQGQKSSETCTAILPDFLHIMLVSYSANLPNFGIKGIYQYKIYEPQVTGIVYTWRGKKAEINPIEAVIQNLGPQGTRRHLAQEFGKDPEDMAWFNDLTMQIYRVIHFGEAYPSREYTEYHRGHKIFTARQVNYDQLMQRLRLIGLWYKNNVRDAQVCYEYYPSLGMEIERTRSMTRSTMAVWVLNRLAFFLNDRELQALGKKTLTFYLEHYFNMRQSLAKGKLIPAEIQLPRGDTPLSKWTSGAFLVAAILERGEFAEYSRQVQLLMQWMSGYQKDNGLFWTDHGQNQFFQPGHLMLVLAELYAKTEDMRYLEMFEKSFQAYQGPIKGLLCLGNDLYATYAPGWYSQAFAAMYQLTGKNAYRDLIFKINDRVAKWYDLNAKDQAYYDYDGLLVPVKGSWGNTSVTAASLESLCAAALTARIAGDKMRYLRYRRVIPHSTAYLLRLQFLPENTYYVRDKKKVIGGFKSSLINNKSWMDSVWHTANALMHIYEHRLLE